jgi:hypothetical protein
MATNRDSLDSRAVLLSQMTGGKYLINKAYSAYRLYREEGNGVEEISPRLSAGQLEDWIDAYRKGIELGMRLTIAKT